MDVLLGFAIFMGVVVLAFLFSFIIEWYIRRYFQCDEIE